MLAIIQPSCCSSCRQPYKSSLADCQRVLDCGCTLCGICSESQLLSFGGTCPSCGHAFSTRNTHTTTKSWSHPRVMADDITAQEARCQYYRNELFQLEREIANTPSPSTQDPLPGDNTDDLAVLSDDSLAITSSDDDEYTNTKYAVVAKRLAALRMRVKTRAARKDEKEKVYNISIATTSPSPSSSTDLAQQALASKKTRARAKRLALVKARRYRMMAQHGASLYVPPPPEKKKKKKKKKKQGDEEEEEEEDIDFDDEEEDDKRKKKKKSTLDPHLKKLSKTQRTQNLISQYSKVVHSYRKKVAVLESRLVDAENKEDEFRVIHLTNQLDRLQSRNDNTWAKINETIGSLQDRLADTGPSAASYLKKQRIQGVLDMWINTFFPPDPVDEEEKDDEDEDDY